MPAQQKHYHYSTLQYLFVQTSHTPSGAKDIWGHALHKTLLHLLSCIRIGAIVNRLRVRQCILIRIKRRGCFGTLGGRRTGSGVGQKSSAGVDLQCRAWCLSHTDGLSEAGAATGARRQESSEKTDVGTWLRSAGSALTLRGTYAGSANPRAK